MAGHGYGGRADDVAAVAPGPAEAATGECDACTAEPGSGDVAALGTSGVADLLRWVEEEKLAHDLYLALADQYAGTVTAGRFERIAASETQHRTAVQTLLATYGLDDPSAGAAAGEFTDPELQALYDTLLAQGSTSVDEALAVGRAVESDDIDLLERTAAQVQADDVRDGARPAAGGQPAPSGGVRRLTPRVAVRWRAQSGPARHDRWRCTADTGRNAHGDA